METSKSSTMQRGILYGIISYISWGAVPVYFKLLPKDIPVYEILCHRIVWSFAIVLAAVFLAKKWSALIKIFREPTKVVFLIASATLIATNWLVFIRAIGANQILDASLGYFINPLMSIFLAMFFFKEKLSLWQWFAVGLAIVGVVFQIIVLGTLPWISLILATTFSLYGVLRKRANVDPITGLLVETLVLLPCAALYLFLMPGTQTGDLFQNGWNLNLLLMLAGIVTAIPLVFFAAAAAKLNFSLLGFLQYIAPSLMWLLAIFVYDEAITQQSIITFSFIWAGLICFSVESIYKRKRVSPVRQTLSASSQ